MASIPTQPSAIHPTKFELEVQQMDQGVQQNLPKTSSLIVNATAMKQPNIDALLQSWLKVFRAVDAAKQTYRDAVNTRKAMALDARTTYKALKAALKLFFGPRSPLLSSFGIAADKPRTTTAKQQMVAAAKRAQTRAVRGTKGKAQRAAIKVVGEPSVSISSGGEVQVGAPPVNVAAIGAASSVVTPSTGGAAAPSSTPAGSDAGSATPSKA